MSNTVREIFVSTIKGDVANGVTGAGTALRTSATNHLFKAAIAKGDIYVTNSDFEILASGNVSNNLYVVQGKGASDVKISHPIETQGIISIKKEAYQAKQQLIKIAGNIGSGSLDLPYTFGKTYTLTIDVKSDFKVAYQSGITRSYTFKAAVNTSLTGDAIDAPKAAFFQQFVDAVNNDPFMSKFVTAALTTTVNASAQNFNGISITAKAQPYTLKYPVNNVYFNIGFQADDLSETAATVTTTQKAIVGSGNYDQVSYAEWEIQHHRGVTNHVLFPVDDPLIYSTPGGTYNLYTIVYNNTLDVDAQRKAFLPCAAIIALDSTNATTITAVEAMLALVADAAGAPFTSNAEALVPDSGDAV